MASVLSSFFSRDPKANFPYELPTETFFQKDGCSMGNSFKKSEPTEICTCFWSQNQPPAVSSLKIQAQKLKTLRHPNVLLFLDSLEIENNFYLITESCVPLSLYIEQTSFKGSQKEYVSSWGLFQLMNCLKFLHNEAKLSHENLRYSVYVTKSGDWKISGFDYAVPFSNPQKDLNSLALIMWEVFNGFSNPVMKPQSPGKMPKKLHDLYKKMASSHAARLIVEDLIVDNRRGNGFLKNAFVDTLLFLDEFQLKDAHDKQNFFSKLQNELDLFPSDVSKYKILPKLIYNYEYGDAGSHILVPLFRLGRLLDEDEYQRRIVPCLCKLFSSPDRATRVKLLEKIDEFASHLKTEVVNERIFGNLASGFMDTNPVVRENTVKAMVSIADKLNYHNLNTELMRHLARLQGSDVEAGIRTNTTICLSKISCYIDPSQRQRILISAFTRAMKDPFPPSRMAAVLAFSATQQFYSLIEVANKIVPALAPLTCDPEKQVRDQAFKALHGFIDKLEKASENPESIAELEAQVKAGGVGSILSSDKVPQWASWALKSLSDKFYKKTSSQSAAMKVVESDNISKGKPDTESLSVAKTEQNISSSNTGGWGDLEDEQSGNENWEDANEGKNMNDDDDWSTCWEKINSPTINKKLHSTKTDRNAAIGTMKLQMKAPFETRKEEEDIDALLDGKKTTMTTQNLAKHTSKIKDSVKNGWDDDSWSNLYEDEGGIEKSSEGWDDFSWGGEAKNVDSSKQIRRAEQQARNEARRKEMLARRTTKRIGAVKLNTKSSS